MQNKEKNIAVETILKVQDIFINQIVNSAEKYGVEAIDPRDFAEFKKII